MTTCKKHGDSDFTYADPERAQLRTWIGLRAGLKIDFFEEMIELGYRSGALSAQRLALRDALADSGGLLQTRVENLPGSEFFRPRSFRHAVSEPRILTLPSAFRTLVLMQRSDRLRLSEL